METLDLVGNISICLHPNSTITILELIIAGSFEFNWLCKCLPLNVRADLHL